MKSVLYFSLFMLLLIPVLKAQEHIKYTTAQAHSHNDYEQKFPFYSAYNEKLGSMEADIFLRNDSLFVAHNLKDIRSDRTLSALYLDPLNAQIKKNGGKIYAEGNQEIQLLIDLKTNSEQTMPVLVKVLEKYQSVLSPKGPVKIVLSGNTPSPVDFQKYPDFIYFDGRPEISYTPAQLARIGLIS